MTQDNILPQNNRASTTETTTCVGAVYTVTLEYSYGMYEVKRNVGDHVCRFHHWHRPRNQDKGGRDGYPVKEVPDEWDRNFLWGENQNDSKP